MFVVVHATNNPRAIEWADSLGANGVELDVHYNESGIPSYVNHGAPCDCSFYTMFDHFPVDPKSVCAHMTCGPSAIIDASEVQP